MKSSLNPSKILVYTAITGGYEKERSDILVMTDDLLKDPRRSARMHKCLTPDFERYEYSLWIDGNTSLKVPVEMLIERHLKDADIAVFKHPLRNCIYDEADACRTLGLDDDEVIMRQMLRYAREGYPTNNGLAATTYVLRRHTAKIEAFNSLWWAEICKGSRRDQLSFDYAAWKLNVKINHFSDKVYFDNFKHNDYFNYKEHGK